MRSLPIISELGIFETDLPTLTSSRFANWPIPALARAKGTWLGALELDHFLPPGTRIEQDCNVHYEFPKTLQKPMEDFVDAFLYLGPQDLRLMEKIPVDVALDVNYRMELQKGGTILGFPEAATETPKEFHQQTVNSAENPPLSFPSHRIPSYRIPSYRIPNSLGRYKVVATSRAIAARVTNRKEQQNTRHYFQKLQPGIYRASL